MGEALNKSLRRVISRAWAVCCVEFFANSGLGCEIRLAFHPNPAAAHPQELFGASRAAYFRLNNCANACRYWAWPTELVLWCEPPSTSTNSLGWTAAS